jgi:glutamate N-acetyltransferase/amino-acid N-acetyltransferase
MTSKPPEWSRALDQILLNLAKMIARDGEGATKKVTLQIEGARTEGEAKTLAMTIANSPLVKTAFFGQDANWGRIMAAMGRAGVPFDPDQVDIYFGQVQVVEKGLGKGPEQELLAGRLMKKPAFTIRIHLHQGPAGIKVYTCDFSPDYVHINAEYRT